MRVKKVLNNNVVIAVDLQNHECVLTGKGIGFGKKCGDQVNGSDAEKVFHTRELGVAEKLSGILQSIPMEYVRVGDEIINMAKRELSGTLNEKIYLTLIDHIYFAIERHKDGIDLVNNMMWEMKQYYASELQVGLKALEIIKNRLGVTLPNDEAAFIAFHLINAGSKGTKLIPVQESLVIVSEIMGIVRLTVSAELDESTHAYNRFLAHLKYLSLRILNVDGPLNINRGDQGLYSRLRTEYPRENRCVDMITELVENKYRHVMTDEEKSYLMIHIHSLMPD